MHGANPDIKTKDGQTCLHLATEELYHDDYQYYRNSVIIKLLLKYGADTELRDDNTGNTALHNALCSFSGKTINLLIDHGADINALTKDGKTAIQLAAVISTDFFSYQLNFLICPDSAIKIRSSALEANIKNRCEMILALWEAGADTKALYENGDSLLHRLCSQQAQGVGLSTENHNFESKFMRLLKQSDMFNVRNLSGDTPIFCALNFMSRTRDKTSNLPYDSENRILRTIKFLVENGADFNNVNTHGYSPLLLAVLRRFDSVKAYLIAKGAVLFPKSRKRLTRSTTAQQAHNGKNNKENEKRLAEIIVDLFFGGETCEYLKSVKESKQGRFGSKWCSRCSCKHESWFRHSVDNEGIVSFNSLLAKVEIWLTANGFYNYGFYNDVYIFCDFELIEQAAKDTLNKLKIIEEESCVICYSKTPIVTFFPCGHKVFCSDCQKISSEKSCACCRQKIMFYTVDVEKKAVEVAA